MKIILFLQGCYRCGFHIWGHSSSDHRWGCVHLLYTEEVQPEGGRQNHKGHLYPVGKRSDKWFFLIHVSKVGHSTQCKKKGRLEYSHNMYMQSWGGKWHTCMSSLYQITQNRFTHLVEKVSRGTFPFIYTIELTPKYQKIDLQRIMMNTILYVNTNIYFLVL